MITACYRDLPSTRYGEQAPMWRRMWPAALGVLVAAGTAYGLTEGRDAAPVVAASGLVYLAAAATGRRSMAWIGFAIAFVPITLEKLTGVDAVPWLLTLAIPVLGYGMISRRFRPWWALPLQSAAMLVFGAIAFIAIGDSPPPGGLLVAGALLGHAAWDIQHYRADRVVSQQFAQFCAVLDILVAALVAVISLGSR